MKYSIFLLGFIVCFLAGCSGAKTIPDQTGIGQLPSNITKASTETKASADKIQGETVTLSQCLKYIGDVFAHDGDAIVAAKIWTLESKNNLVTQVTKAQASTGAIHDETIKIDSTSQSLSGLVPVAQNANTTIIQQGETIDNLKNAKVQRIQGWALVFLIGGVVAAAAGIYFSIKAVLYGGISAVGIAIFLYWFSEKLVVIEKWIDYGFYAFAAGFMLWVGYKVWMSHTTKNNLVAGIAVSDVPEELKDAALHIAKTAPHLLDNFLSIVEPPKLDSVSKPTQPPKV